MSLPIYSDYKSIVLKDIPLIDLRAPVEFEKGAFKNAVNLPLMSNEERHLVGIRYKNNGNEAAIKLGYELVSGDIKKSRVDAWVEFIEQNPNTIIYCFRGGQRSQIAQKWLKERGVEVARVDGGYKAFRGYLIERLDSMQGQFKPLRVGGRTGSAKTALLHKLQNSIDLEGLANHRGSAFGKHISPQPTQINFENSLAYELLHKINRGYENIIFEDEGRNIGKVYLPQKLFDFISSGSLVFLERDLKDRVDIIFNEYVIDAQLEFSACYGKELGLELWYKSMLDSLMHIKKRLGGKLYSDILKLLNSALLKEKKSGDLSLHKLWIEPLLVQYYDPMYDYQLEKRQESIVFRGNYSEVLEFLLNSR